MRSLGPVYWGLINPNWRMCDKGMQQSPVNVDPGQLLFDPGLKPLYVDNVAIDAVLENTGQMLLIRPNHSVIPGISGGSLGAYQYRLHEVHFHYGDHDGVGSEHAIADRFLPGEVRLASQ